VLAEVLQHVNQCIPHLTRGAQHARVIPVRPHGPAAADRAIDGAGHADGETLEPAHEGRVAVSFDEEVQVVELHAELEQAEAPP